MSTNNRHGQHLSASQRHIAHLEARVAMFEQMQKEYNLILNLLVSKHGNLESLYVITKEEMEKLEVRAIKTEISPDGLMMTIQRLPKSDEQT